MTRYRINFKERTDTGFKIEKLASNGYVTNTVDITKEQLPKAMKELCSLSGEDKMIDTVRLIKNKLGLKSIKVTKHG